MGKSGSTTTTETQNPSTRRFRVALSFTGEQREYVEQIAEILANELGKDKILYDKYHEAEFARRDLGLYLPPLYREESDLVVAILCPAYKKKTWTGLEWMEIHALNAEREDGRVMLCRFNYATVPGLNKLSGFVELDKKTPLAVANLIQQRLAQVDALLPAASPEIKPVLSSAPPNSPTTKPLTLPPALLAVPAYIGSHSFIGRTFELQTIDDWANTADTHALLLFEAIGGNGKSMLTWHWVKNHANTIRKDWAGQFWYSFYERGTTMEGFARHALAYITGVASETLNKLRMYDLSEQLLAHLKAKPYLLILDGLERALVAYNRYDAATMADEEADTATDQIANRNPCDATNPDDDAFLRALATVQPTKVLVSSRLTPRVFINPSGQPIPGVRREFLGGLRPADAEVMFKAQGVKGDAAEMQRYLVTNCACHPLVIGVIAGLINNYPPKRGNFDAWVNDASELGGARINLAELDLKQKKNHILRAAIQDLPQPSRRLLSTLALIHNGVDYALLKALNPHLPPKPAEVEEPAKPEEHRHWERMSEEERKTLIDAYSANIVKYEAYEQAVRVRLASNEYKSAERNLRATLQDMLQRGLLQYDTNAYRYDLHPVVRGVALGKLNAEEKNEFGQSVVDYFSARDHNPYEDAQTMEHVANGVQLVRTYIEMGQMEQAADVYLGELANALLFNLEAHEETLALLKPFFPTAWDKLPEGVDSYIISSLLNYVLIALDEFGMSEVSMACVSPKMQFELSANAWYEVEVTLWNIVATLRGMNRLHDMGRCIELAHLIAKAHDNNRSLFIVRIHRFRMFCLYGKMDQAQATWDLLDPMGRDWNRAVYRPGIVESCYAEFQFTKGVLTEEHLLHAQTLAASGKNRLVIRHVHALRGQWRAERGEWGMAVPSLTEAVRMAREVRTADSWSETFLALANHHRGILYEPRNEAQRLAALPRPAHRPLAELYLALGDRTDAIKHALAAYTWAWADGEPYVRRTEFTKSAALLNKLGQPPPTLLGFAESKHPPFPWEADVQNMIENIKQEKAEEAAKKAAKTARPDLSSNED